MRKLALTIATGALLASGVHADWVISSYPTPMTDSALVKATYGPTTFTNPASTVNLTVPAAGELAFTGAFASDGTAGYSANVGVIHPLSASWEVGNLTGLTAISFDLKLSAKPTEGVGVSVSSKGYGKYNDEGKTHGSLLAPSVLPAANVWKTFIVPLEDLQPPGWWTPEADFPEIDSILKVVEAIQFSPKTLYSAGGTQNGDPCTKCVTPTTTNVVMTLRNITLVGVESTPLVNPTNVGCAGPSVVLDDFADADAQNYLGGYWYAYSDTSSDPAKLLDSARGSSTASFLVGEEGGYAAFGAGLNKNIAGSPFAWRPYAGWAAVGTGFEGDDTLLADMLTGIEFKLQMAKKGVNVSGINFKVTIPGVDDAKTHFVMIPTRQIDADAPEFSTSVCIRPEDLKQPSWVTPPVLFNPSMITKLAWEAKITDQKLSSISADSVNFLISDVKLHGQTEFLLKNGGVPGSATRRISKSAFSAIYANGALSVKGLSGYNTLSVVAPSGKVLSSFDAKLGSKQIKLDRGTYFLVARGDAGKTLSRKIVVLK